MLQFFDRSIVKHGTQNIQNNCHQLLSDSFRVHRIRFRPGLRSGPHWGSLQRSPDALADLRGPTSEGEERGGRGKIERKRGEEGDGRDRPSSFANFWIRPWSVDIECGPNTNPNLLWTLWSLCLIAITYLLTYYRGRKIIITTEERNRA